LPTEVVLFDIQRQLQFVTAELAAVKLAQGGQQPQPGAAVESGVADAAGMAAAAVAASAGGAAAEAPPDDRMQLLSSLGLGPAAPFVPDPSQVTNSTAGAVPGLDAAAMQLAAGHSTLNLNSSVPIYAAGFGAAPPAPAHAHAQPGEQLQAASGVFYGFGESMGSEAVPLQPLLPEQVVDRPGFGAISPETQMQVVIGFNNQPVMKAMPPASKKLKGAEELVALIPNYSAYLLAHEKVCQGLHLHGFSVAGMPRFQRVMLQQAALINHNDSVEWGMFLVLDQLLRLKQHAYRRRWDFADGYLSLPDISAYQAQVAGRKAALEAQKGRGGPSSHLKPPRPPGNKFRNHQGGEPAGGAAGPQPTDGTDCKQWWWSNKCTFGSKCKFAHVCRTCNSTSHGTAHCSSQRAGS